MIVQYTNRKGMTYYLHEDSTKTVDLRYFFSAKDEGNVVGSMPEGYEIYEDPNSQVFLRRIQPQAIAENERDIVNRYVRELNPSKRYAVDVWGKDITVYESNEDIDVLRQVFSESPPKGLSAEQVVDLTISFAPALRFTLEETKERTFVVKRYCLPGSFQEWRHIDGPDSLENLAKKYVRYLGTDSFRTLF